MLAPRLAAILAAVLAGACTSGPTLETRAPEPGDARFDARALLVLSDADMAGTAYADGQLRRLDGGEDRLASVADMAASPAAALAVSNSVMGWPGAMDVAPDGRFALVTETQGPAPSGATRLADDGGRGLPPGRWLTSVDVSNPAQPVETGRIEVGLSPNAVQIAPDGRFALVSNTQRERPLVAVVLDAGRAVRVIDLKLALPDLGAAPRDAGATFVRLSPNGRDFAVNIANTHVGLGRLALDADGVPTGAALIGQPVATDGWITMLRWSADGRHVLFADTAWNGGGLGAAINGPGRIGSLAVSADGAHRLVSQAQVSLSPEGFELSPDGVLIAVVNMERTYLPDALPYALFGRRDRSSLSLVAFDAATGALRVADGPVGFDGVLPEDVMFDADGDMLAVAVFHERSAAPKAGRVDYWRIDRSTGAPRLVPTGRSTTVMRGAHDLALIK